MCEGFKIWLSNKIQKYTFLLWLKNNEYIFFDSKEKFSLEIIHEICVNGQSGFVIDKTKKSVYLSPIIYHKDFSKILYQHLPEITFNEFKKQYLEEDKMTEKIFDNFADIPKLETGMFVKDMVGNIGVVVYEKIIYNNGDWDSVKDGRGYISSVFNHANCFDDIARNPKSYLIWEFKKYFEISKQEIKKQFRIPSDCDFKIVD